MSKNYFFKQFKCYLLIRGGNNQNLQQLKTNKTNISFLCNYYKM